MNLRKLDILITHANPKRSIMLKGVHGLGKTQWVKQLAKRLGLKFVIWHASHAADAGDITGLPKQIKETVVWYDKDGVEHKEVYDVTAMCPPKWMIHHEPVLLLLDEFNRGMGVALNALMQLTCEQAYDEVQLPEGSRVIACVNPDSDNTYDVGKLDPAQLSRFDVYEFTPTPEEWVEWARGNGIHEMVIDFIMAHPRYLDPYANEDLVHSVSGNDMEKLPDRRAWAEAVSVFMTNGDKDHLFEDAEGIDLLHEAIAGMVGLGAADEFMAFYANAKNALNPRAIIKLKHIPDEIHARIAEAMQTDITVGLGFIKSCAMFIEDNVNEVFKKTEDAKIWCNNLYDLIDKLPTECRVSAGIDILYSAVEQKKQWAKAIFMLKPEFKELVRSVKMVNTSITH